MNIFFRNNINYQTPGDSNEIKTDNVDEWFKLYNEEAKKNAALKAELESLQEKYNDRKNTIDNITKGLEDATRALSEEIQKTASAAIVENQLITKITNLNQELNDTKEQDRATKETQQNTDRTKDAMLQAWQKNVVELTKELDNVRTGVEARETELDKTIVSLENKNTLLEEESTAKDLALAEANEKLRKADTALQKVNQETISLKSTVTEFDSQLKEKALNIAKLEKERNEERSRADLAEEEVRNSQKVIDILDQQVIDNRINTIEVADTLVPSETLSMVNPADVTDNTKSKTIVNQPQAGGIFTQEQVYAYRAADNEALQTNTAEVLQINAAAVALDKNKTMEGVTKEGVTNQSLAQSNTPLDLNTPITSESQSLSKVLPNSEQQLESTINEELNKNLESTLESEKKIPIGSEDNFNDEMARQAQVELSKKSSVKRQPQSAEKIVAPILQSSSLQANGPGVLQNTATMQTQDQSITTANQELSKETEYEIRKLQNWASEPIKIDKLEIKEKTIPINITNPAKSSYQKIDFEKDLPPETPEDLELKKKLFDGQSFKESSNTNNLNYTEHAKRVHIYSTDNKIKITPEDNVAIDISKTLETLQSAGKDAEFTIGSTEKNSEAYLKIKKDGDKTNITLKRDNKKEPFLNLSDFPNAEVNIDKEGKCSVKCNAGDLEAIKETYKNYNINGVSIGEVIKAQKEREAAQKISSNAEVGTSISAGTRDGSLNAEPNLAPEVNASVNKSGEMMSEAYQNAALPPNSNDVNLSNTPGITLEINSPVTTPENNANKRGGNAMG